MRRRRLLVFLAGVLTTAPIRSALHAQAPSETDLARALVTKHLELMNSGQWKEAAAMFAPDVRHHLGNWQSGEEKIVTGQDTLTANLEDLFRTFPDWKMEIVEIVAAGDSVAVRCRVSGTHRGVGTRRINGGFLMGIEPTGKRFVVQHIHWYKVRDGRITDHFTNRDDLGMTQQLGLLPYPQPAEQDRAGIDKTRNEYVSAWKAADADRLANLYTADALVLYPNQPAVVGRSEILAYFKSSFAELAPEDFELESAEIEIAGPWAFDRGTYRWKAVARAGGDPMADHGKYLVVLHRQPDGSWRVARDMDNSDSVVPNR